MDLGDAGPQRRRRRAGLALAAGAAGLLTLSSIGWLAVCVPWAIRLMPVYLQRRADGRPG